MIYTVLLSDTAKADMAQLSDVIANKFSAPLTEIKYMRELKAVIKNLEKNSECYAVRQSVFLQKYGTNVRRIDYKKMAIIYTIHDDTVYIHRIMAGALILE